MEKKYVLEESELKDLLKARAILDVLRDCSVDYMEDNAEYMERCIADFGCRDLDEVAEKLILEFEYPELN